MDHTQSREAIKQAMDYRPWKWLAARLGYASTDYVVRMLTGAEPAPRGFYDDVAAILGVHVRAITPDGVVYTFPRLGLRGTRVAGR